ncbi:dnaJ subfamily C member 13-like isoform X2 [Leptotrombidium deliense]|uniref:DnaJ subfamily C member 13-like isoform X2 n=1 Tax=Leptotrombidium deliense TaxID=299467 RepID=A0A443SRY6_9ACAR|nr:dnaJ subfamily C member 13-like isoform X2 [Leptotrombidium deliense]
MNSLKDNKDLSSFLVTKHSWKGKYKRIFSVGTECLTTYNPGTMEVTNQWTYNEVINVTPLIPKIQHQEPTLTTGGNELFMLTFKKRSGKVDTMKFSSEYRCEILCSILVHRHKFVEVKPKTDLFKYNCHKFHWSEKKIPITLEINIYGVNQISQVTGKNVVTYLYKDIECLIALSDCSGGFVISTCGFGRFHCFACSSEERDDLMKKIVDFSWNYAGAVIRIRKEAITFDHFQTHRFGKYSSDESVTSIYEFTVHKLSTRTPNELVKRILALTDTCLVERDPNTYAIVTLKPLNEIFALIRSISNPQLFSVEYMRGQVSSYTSTDRDALLASLLDGVRASGNIDIHVKMMATLRGFRLGPYSMPVDEEVESLHLKFLQTQPLNWSFNDAVVRFNCNCAYSGLLHTVTADGLFAENKEKLIQTALGAFVEKEGDQDEISNESLEQQFQGLRRLVASKAGFAAFTLSPRFRECLGIKVVKALKRNNDAVTHSAIDMLCALLQVSSANPMHDDYDLRQEQLNKSSLLASKPFLESLLDVLKEHIEAGTGALVVASMLDFLTFSLCAPYSETTDGGSFDSLLSMVASYGRSLFKLFQHPSLAIVKGAGLVMKAIIEEGDAEIATKMQNLALSEGSLLRHLQIALFSPVNDGRFLAFQQLSRSLLSLWIVDNETAFSLLGRIFPLGLLNYLESSENPPKNALTKLLDRNNLKLAQDHSNKNRSAIDAIRDIHPSVRVLERHVENVLQHWRERIGIPKRDLDSRSQQKLIVLRRRRERVKSSSNWAMFFYQFNVDHSKPDLIWNFKTREELRDALENELRSFNTDRELSAKNVSIAWNHREFEIHYTCLSDEIKIGDYYLKLLLDEPVNSECSISEHLLIKKPYHFFNDVYHRFLLSSKSTMKSCCLQAMSIVYGAYHEQIGSFHDIRFIVGMLERCCDKLERDRLILFLSKLILNERNVKELIDTNGLKILVDLLTLAHLHVNRAIVPTQTNVIEASAEMMANTDTEKEWYYGNSEKDRQGPYSFKDMKELWSQGTINSKTRCWAQGIDGWKALVQIPQLKWTLMATGNAIMNESELSALILDIFVKICEYYPSRDMNDAIIRPLPRVKRYLSDSSCLPHIVQLLLTFDPSLVEKVASLLTALMQDNPNVSRLYLNGVFYFLLMYSGSNILPIGRLLHTTHTNQAFRSEDKTRKSSIMQRSILGQLLPEAMVCYLENYGPEKFAQIFLGEFDTPEAIWNGEMRRLMVEKIATHVADFSPRLKSNTRALYQYCPIPPIQYPQLENELFCNIFYLKNLCDTQRFLNWPIKNPVDLLRDILEAWKEEVEKKPPSMSIEDAFEILGVTKNLDSTIDENIIRKAYFKMAQKYHPDKNPDGREMFEEISKAYEFLCSKNVRFRCIEGPDPVNITLILKAQSILFSQCSDELHPYKYAGYPMLVKTLKMETQDEQLFSKQYPLLAYAAETAYHTVACSALNAEELRREGGLEILQEALNRCVSVLSHSSKNSEVSVEVSTHIVRCFTVAASFHNCRKKVTEMFSIARDISRILYYSNLTKLCLCAVECVSAFAADELLQLQLFEAGVLFSLLLFLFKYDFTLEESGVESTEDSNKQQVLNQLAKMSVIACARLAGDLSTEEKVETAETNVLIKRCLSSLLTPYVARQLGLTNVAEVLKTLNSNVESPYLIWDNSTRAELIDYLETQQKEKIRSGECPDESYGANFMFSSHRDELIVGEIFVRVYNEQPNFPLTNAKEFTVNLLDYVGSQAQYLHSVMALTNQNNVSPERLNNVQMCLKALRNVIQYNPGVEVQCIGHFKLLFCLLRLDQFSEMQYLVVNVIASVTGNQECVNDIAASQVLVYLLLVLRSSPKCEEITKQTAVVDTLVHLMSNSKLVKEVVEKGCILYLLDLFCNSVNSNLREKCAELLAKMTADKLVGPRVRLILCKFVPVLFVEAMKDSPQTATHLFDGTQENPELIWNDSARKDVCSTLKTMAEELHQSQSNNPAIQWKIPEDFELSLPITKGEVVVAGVYLRLFVQNPSWVLRRPKEFLTELMQKVQSLMIKPENNNSLELVTKALTCLLASQPALLDLIPPMGYIKSFIDNLSNKKSEDASKSCLLVIHQLANSKLCVNAIAQIEDSVSQIIVAMKSDETVASIACETLDKLFIRENDELILQAIKADLIPFLLCLLDSNKSKQSSSTKAIVVQLLKNMSQSQTYGQQILAILDRSEVWLEFRNQKHDLFITNSQTAGYLTGTANVAGYLTQGGSMNIVSAPPPMREF